MISMKMMDVYKISGKPWSNINIDDLAERIRKDLTSPVNFIYYEVIL